MKVEFVTNINDYIVDHKTKIFAQVIKSMAKGTACSETVGYFHKRPDNSGFELRTSWNLL
ncbi:MAG: hypothetical protein WCK67_01295 [bacterium]